MSNSTYTAISIGPIIATLSQVRKPRHLWSASYVFSHLMKIIIEAGIEMNGKLISQDQVKDRYPELGLYPDRVIFEGDLDAEALTKVVFENFATSIGITEEQARGYFNIMILCIESESESVATRELHKKLDVLELANRCEDSDARKGVLELISSGTKSTLYELAFESGNFPVNTLAEIAAIETKFTNEEAWQNASDFEKLFDKTFSSAKKKSLINEDLFYFLLKKRMQGELKSYHKYFCVVQADGDNMGKVFGNLQDGKLQDLSQSLIAFGKAASKLIKDFGGLPIYAGGDDLLFLAPVVSKKKRNIFDLLNYIDYKYQRKVIDKANELQNPDKKVETSMSYGISINYYKHPLYEALNNARDLLFVEAKNHKSTKNTIVCNLRKHSGASFKVVLDKKQDDIKKAFEELTGIAAEDKMVSAAAHKLRENNVLWQATKGDENRLKAFFKSFMEWDEKEPTKQDKYLGQVREILKLLMDKEDNAITQNIYSMLRIAKFINGEEAKDE